MRVVPALDAQTATGVAPRLVVPPAIVGGNARQRAPLRHEIADFRRIAMRCCHTLDAPLRGDIAVRPVRAAVGALRAFGTAGRLIHCSIRGVDARRKRIGIGREHQRNPIASAREQKEDGPADVQDAARWENASRAHRVEPLSTKGEVRFHFSYPAGRVVAARRSTRHRSVRCWR
jgi:hypothetical protein